ncbi:hypothetical protein G6F57_009475 [Rhizopus arrhizus]|nr:hypothetical protein G6F30_010096 [Rhizopus arrhizus]KAG1423205.1 hypothetical protein G6F58_002913 [Rhizopus delemar]KAG0983552.1 hypothetical protein G6F29_005448 [Rhizopus arrhizus]KAG0995054.1 hypothetical protein G6F28_005159 [Rhizopus arrhizus]KAG1019357.1 hypothetical protein G6F26_010187 [Rhizopus arrhizus]
MTTKLENRLEALRLNVMDSGGIEEKVEVNQRHLIDKILARYSAEYVLYRELMQNADDALSSAVQICFHTNSPESSSKTPNLSAKCNKIVFKNNGMPFRPEDWVRLKRIAEGNPDEQKIGAFGVGFYSLFSVCENPFVFSGSQCMAFYFKGDQLFAKRADVPEKDVDSWTSFLMDLREPMEMPDFDHFCQFLTTSMGFTANLREVTVFFDNQQIFTIKKRVAEPRAMKIDTRQMLLNTPQRMFTITGSDTRQIQLDSEKYTPPSLFQPLANLLGSKKESSTSFPVEKASIFLRVVTASLNVSVTKDYEKEMERATKKKPPKTTKFQLVYTGKEELDASENNNAIFKNLIPFPNQGCVFIGFPTHQTTGCCCHMASRFIPTVERESIDFADRYISIWNKELLAVGGLLARLVYNDEMEQIARLYRELVGTENHVDKTVIEGTDSAKLMLEKRAAHALSSFSFQHSTPSSIVGKVHEEWFFKSCKSSLTIMTSHGIQPINTTRTVPDHLSLTGHSVTQLLDKFIKTIPTIPSTVYQDCKEGITKLTNYGLLLPLGLSDVLKELAARPLQQDEMVACMRWWVECNTGNTAIPASTRSSINDATRAQFLEAAIMDCGEEKGFMQLSKATYWQNPKIIPLDMNVPPDTMPFSVSKNFSTNELTSYFGNMKELSVVQWTYFIYETNPELQKSTELAERVLGIISKSFSNISSKSENELIQLLKSKTCIPTRFGMKLPEEAYFSNVNLFDDLPTIQFNNPRHVNDTFLAALGVRKHVELQIVFDRLISDGSWSHVDLIKYLTSVQSTLSEVEIRRLRGTAIFTKEGEEPRIKEIEVPKAKVNESGPTVMEKHQKKIYKRYKATDLFSPTDIAKSLHLPVIYWTPRWRTSSDEAKFLVEKLGLNTSPPLDILLNLAAPDAQKTVERRKIQTTALTYFIEHHKEYQGKYDPRSIDIKFLPCSDGNTYAAPRNCFTNSDVQLLGFQRLHHDLIPMRDKLGVRENPTAEQLIQAFLSNIETDHNNSKKRFEYMASRMGDLSRSHWQQLKQTAFIPANQNNVVVLKEPSNCYFESDGSASFHKELFLFVNFGTLANSFLRSCGVKDEPNTVELASMIVKDPQRFWDLSSGGERYLGALRQIAGQFYLIRSNRQLLNDMKTKPFLVGIKRMTLSEQQQQQSSSIENEENSAEGEFVQYRLAKASDIFIIDDTMGHQIFSPLSAPMEPLLEEFYRQLGSQMLSTQIKETYSYSNRMGVTDRTKKITEMIFERTPIIIYQMMNDNPQRRKELLHDEQYVKQHLKVIQVQELKINRSFKHTGEKNVQPTTACADRVDFGIYVSNAKEIDYYDVANALCVLLFARVQFNDAIIVERYLTVSLLNLRRKGVPVDRILNIRKQHVTSPAPPPLTTTSPTQPPPSMPRPLPSQELDKYTKQVQEVFGDCQEGYIRQLLAQQHENHVQNVIDRLLQETYPKKSNEIKNQIISTEEEMEEKRKQAEASKRVSQQKPSGFMNRLWSTWKQPVTSASTPSSPTPSVAAAPVNQETNEDKRTKLPKSETTITPNYTDNIRQNLKRAIHSCRPYAGQDVFTPPRINQVTESRQYCDATPGHNLTYVGNVLGMEFYVHRTVKSDDVLEQYGQSMARFTSILSDLAKVFELRLATIQIFYDKEGPTIAFNLSGSLFMNLRYYLALHESETEDGRKRKEALIYWFMTICHELAHNFVADHSSEHEFYMSSFAENYLESLMNHIYANPSV